MNGYQLLLFFLVLWLFGALVSKKEKAYRQTKSLFENQNWSVWFGVYSITIFFSLQVLVFWPLWSFREKPWFAILQFILEILFFMGILFFFRKRLDKPIGTLGISFKHFGRNIVFGGRWMIGYFLLGEVMVYSLLSIDPTYLSQEKLSNHSIIEHPIPRLLALFGKEWGTWSLFIPILFLVIFRPIFEEFLFRGLLYGPFRKKLGPIIANLSTAGFFAWVHGSNYPVYFVSGMLLAYFYEQTQSITIPIFFHGIFNLVGVLQFFYTNATGPIDDFMSRTKSIIILLATLFIFFQLAHYWTSIRHSKEHCTL